MAEFSSTTTVAAAPGFWLHHVDESEAKVFGAKEPIIGWSITVMITERGMRTEVEPVCIGMFGPDEYIVEAPGGSTFYAGKVGKVLFDSLNAALADIAMVRGVAARKPATSSAVWNGPTVAGA